MHGLYIVTIIYLYFPLVIALVRRHADTTGFKDKAIAPYIKNRFIYCNVEVKFLIVLSITIATLLPITIYTKLTGSNTTPLRIVALATMLLTSITSAAFALKSQAIAEGYKKYRKLWAFLITISAAINTSRAASFAESYIANLTGVRGNDIPTALARLSLLMAPIAWAISLSFMFLAIYTIALFKTVVIDPKNKVSLTQLHGAHIVQRRMESLGAGIAISVCFAMLAVSPLSLLEATLKSEWIDAFIRDQIVDASFHVPADKCNAKNKGALIAYLENEKALIAFPENRMGYIFKKIQCPATWSKPEDN